MCSRSSLNTINDLKNKEDEHATMEGFQKFDDKYYIGFVVANQCYNDINCQYVERGRILFSNEEDAQKCLGILEEFNRMCRFDFKQRNTLVRDMCLFDGTTIHTLSGYKVTFDKYVFDKQNVETIEKEYPNDSWRYMDAYVKLFGYKPRRPRSSLGILMCCLTCLCGYDEIYTKTVSTPKNNNVLPTKEA